jgi:hypothetical protein
VYKVVGKSALMALVAIPGQFPRISFYPPEPFDRTDGLEIKVNAAIFATRYQYEHGWEIAGKGRKLLVLKYTLANTADSAREYSRTAVNFGIVLPNGEKKKVLTIPEKLLVNPKVQINAGQSVSDITCLEVPADLENPNLYLYINRAEKPLSLSVKIENQLGIFGRPSSNVALDEAETHLKDTLRLGVWNVQISKPSYAAEPPSFRVQAPADCGYAVVPVRFENPLGDSQGLTAYAMRWDAVTTDGRPVKWSRMLLNNGGDPMDQEVKSRRAATGRLVFYVPNGAKLASIRATDPSSSRSISVRID